MPSWTTDGSATSYQSPTLTEIKNYLSIDGSAYDDLLNDIKYSVFSRLERLTGQNLNDASGLTVTVRYEHLERVFIAPLLPVTSITSVTSYASDDSSTAYTSTSNYSTRGILSTRNGEFSLDVFVFEKALEWVYVSNGSDVPYDFKLAALGWIKKIWNDERDFTGRENKIQPPEFTMNLIQPYIRVHV